MNTARPERITLRASKKEKEYIKQKCSSCNYTLQKYVLDCALDSPPILSHQDAKQVIGELRRIGNNLNQIAHEKNIGKPINKFDLQSNIKEVENICQSLKQ